MQVKESVISIGKEKEKLLILPKFSMKYRTHFLPLGFYQEYVMANSFLSTLIGNISNVDLVYYVIKIFTAMNGFIRVDKRILQ